MRKISKKLVHIHVDLNVILMWRKNKNNLSMFKKCLWLDCLLCFQEIPPYETKAVMKANFVGRVENNHTAFIRIKTNQEKKSHLLILPVEVEVSSCKYIIQQVPDSNESLFIPYGKGNIDNGCLLKKLKVEDIVPNIQ